MTEGRLGLDLDGTLLDARPRQCELAEAALHSEGYALPFDRQRFWSLKREGSTTLEAFDQLGIDEGLGRRAARYWRAHVEDPRWLARDRLLPDVEAVLSDLARGGLDLVLLTARVHAGRARAQIERLGLTRHCAEVVVVSPGDAVAGKARELRRLDALGFVGDSESDGAAAAAAGVAFVAVTTGQRSPSFLSSRGFATAPVLADACRILLGRSDRVRPR